MLIRNTLYKSFFIIFLFSGYNLFAIDLPDSHLSSNFYHSSLVPDSQGVFPVVLLLSDIDEISSVVLEVFDQDGNLIKKCTHAPEQMIVLSDCSPDRPGIYWSYRYYFSFTDGTSSSCSEMQKAYGAITDEAYVKFFERYAMKPWEFVSYEDYPEALKEKWSSSKIKEKIDKRGLGSLGRVVESSIFHEGTVEYLSRINWFTGDIFFYYTNFGELEDFWVNGEFSMHQVSLSGNAKYCDGSVQIDGMYPGSIDFSHLEVVDYSPAGVYRVSQANRPGVVSEVEATAN